MTHIRLKGNTAFISAVVFALAGCATHSSNHGLNSSIDVRGLTQPVDIVRDKFGVSHIYAKNQRDLFFAQGWNAARDRLWQLDQWRRKGEGKMAEQFGPRFAAQDRAARLFLFRGDLEAEYASYHPEGKEILTAFSEGINAYIAEAKSDPAKMPVEFKLTGTEPGNWSPTSSLIRIYGITRNVSKEVNLAQRINALGVAKVQELGSFQPPIDLKVPAGVDLSLITPEILADYNLAHKGLPFQASDFPKSPLNTAEPQRLVASLSTTNNRTDMTEEQREALTHESNNWTISGSRTESGKPILAGDPHRSIAMPSLRYMVHLNAPGWNMTGAGEPALPGLSMGHNDRIAFGLTIFAFGDEEDLYVYDTNPAKPDEYRYAGNWESMKRISETIKVRGQSDVNATLKFTRHGPVLYEDTVHHKAYAVRAAYLEFPGTAAYLASLRLNQAQNWSQFTEGMAHHFTPAENMVYADVDGNIGWFGGALVPIRGKPDWSGLLPVSGDGTYEWQGHLAGTLLPRSYNPAAGFYATANEFNVPADYAYLNLSARDSWAESYRHDRIVEVLSSPTKTTVADSVKLQYDETNLPARRLVPFLNGVVSSDPDVAQALDLLRSWNLVSSADSVAATIYEVWQPKVIAKVSDLAIPPAARKVFPSLTKPQVFDRLAAPDASFGSDPTAGRNALLLGTLKTAVTDLKSRLGSDTSKWAWGNLHHIQFDHELAPFLSKSVAASYATSRYPVGGTNDTVHRGTYRNSDYRQTSGSSYRQVMDLGNWDKSLAISVPGQSADPKSPYYANLLADWAKGNYFPMAFTKDAVASQKAETTTLKPRK